MSKKGSCGNDRTIFVLSGAGTRRHKNWCENHRASDNFCSVFCGKCIGAAHCDYYKEKRKR